MNLTDVRSASLSNRKAKRVGRGQASGLGKTCGRGREGATSRSGWAMKPTYEGGQMSLFRRLPKRGFTNGPFKIVYSVVNVGDLQAFESGSQVGREQLESKGLLAGRKGLPIKILGEGDLTHAITVKADRFSKSAEDKIVAAGGSAEWRGGKPKKPAPNFVRIAKEALMAEKLKEALEKPKPQALKKTKKAGGEKTQKAGKEG